MNPSPDQPGHSGQGGAIRLLKMVERGLLIAVGCLTLVAAGLEGWAIVEKRDVTLADILLMFLYTEVFGMIATFYVSSTLVVIYPIFIAITALSRLIVLQGKEMDPLNILFEATAILILALAVLILRRHET